MVKQDETPASVTRRKIFADGPVVMYKPGVTTHSDGRTSHGWTFPLFEVNEWLNDRNEVAKQIAECLDEHYDDRD